MLVDAPRIGDEPLSISVAEREAMRSWIIACALLTLPALAGCGENTSNPAPARLVAPVTLEERASTIRLPVGIPLSLLEKAINAEVPTLLQRIDEPQQTCIKTKSRLIPDISCRLVGSVTRGPIKVSGAGGGLMLTMPVRATVAAENIGKIIKRETANGSIVIRARVDLGLTPQWKPRAHIRADYSWTNRIGIDFLGRRITFASKVDPKLKAVLAQLERSLPGHITKLQVREKVASVWAKGFTTVQIKSDPQIWVRFTPEKVGFSGYRVVGDQLVVGFAARARTETLFGDRPEPAPVTPLPDLMRDLPRGGIDVYVPVLIRYSVLETVARKIVFSREYKGLKLKGGVTVDAEFANIAIYGTPDNGIAVGLDVALKTLGGSISTKGRVWFVARPTIDIDRKIVGISDLTVVGQMDSRAFDLLVEAVNRSSIRDRMVREIRYDFSRDYAAGLAKADQWMEAEPLEGFVFKGDLVDARIHKVHIAPDGLLVEASAAGTGAMTYAPREAARLVEQRRQRRLARERAAAGS
jgi:hypothetical protein